MKRYPLVQRRQPTQKDRDNLAALRTGGSPGSKHSGSTPEQCRSYSGVSEIPTELETEQLTEEELKIRRNEQDRERRLRAMQNRLEVINELKESGYLLHRINYG